MYCVKCGVELSDSETKCPLCGTEVILPVGLKREKTPSIYPPFPGQVQDGMTRSGILFVITSIFFILALISFCCDMSLNHEIIWSGYVMLSLAFIYFVAVFPSLFKRKISPIICAPLDFAALLGLVLYINCKTGGAWFLSFAFPIIGMLGLVATAVTVLYKLLPAKSRLFIYGGAMLTLGCMSMLIELFTVITFKGPKMFTWSLYPLVVLCSLGAMLIVIGLSPSLRESLRKKLFF